MNLILLILSVTISSALAATDCESQAKTWPQTLAGLVGTALQSGVLDTGDLDGIINDDDWSNPIVRKERSPENLALRNGISRALSHIKSHSNRTEARLRLAEVIKKYLELQQKVEDVSIETQNVILPKPLDVFDYDWPPEYLHQRKAIAGTFKGRPVFLAVFSQNVMLIDPFHPEAKKRIRHLTSLADKLGPSDYGFIERDGKTYAQILEAKFTYDLEAEQEVQLDLEENLKFEKVNAGGKTFLTRIAQDKSIIVRAEGEPDWIYPSTSDQERADPTVLAIDGRFFVGFSESKLSESGEQNSGTILRVDMETREVVNSQLFNFWQPTHHQTGRSELKSLVVTHDLFRLDWRTMKVETLFETYGMVNPFSWKGRDLILMGYRILDLETLSLAAKFTWTNARSEIFAYQGQLYALNIEADKKLWLMQLTQPSPK